MDTTTGMVIFAIIAGMITMIFTTLVAMSTVIFTVLVATSTVIFTATGATAIVIFTATDAIGTGTFFTTMIGIMAEAVMATVRQEGFTSTRRGGMDLAIAKRELTG